jgi:hypothetical protein
VWDGKLWSIGGYNSIANTDSVAYMNKSGLWTFYKGTVPTSSHAAGILSMRDKLFYVLGNETNESWELSKGNSIAIGGSSPNASAILDLQSTTKGLLLPRMTKAQRNAIVSPVAGLCIYQTDNIPGFRMYNGTNWVRFTENID